MRACCILGGELLLALPATVIVHELGHWLVARRVGFRVRSFTAGPLSIVWTAAGRQVRLRWRTWLGGGLVLVEPSADAQLGRRAAWFAAGGILANLGMAVLFAVAALVSWRGAPSGWLALVLGLPALCAAVHGLVALIPLSSSPGTRLPSDGHHVLGLLRGRREVMLRWRRKALLADVAAHGHVQGAVAPALLSDWARESPQGDVCHLLLLLTALERHSDEEVEHRIAAALTHDRSSEAPILTDFLLHAAAFFALRRPDLIRARALVKQASARLRERPAHQALLAALLQLAEGDGEAAQRGLATWEQHLHTAPAAKVDAAMMRWLLAEMRAHPGLSPQAR